MTRVDLVELLERYVDQHPDERATARRILALVEAEPRCFLRDCFPGHITASAWIVSRESRAVLLTHHRKLDRWLQLGGHVDGEADLAMAAWREAREESGLTRLRLVTPEIFDVDRHRIPARGAEPEHWHYDVRFLIEADPTEALALSHESKELAWVRLEEVGRLNAEESLARMVRKTVSGRG